MNQSFKKFITLIFSAFAFSIFLLFTSCDDEEEGAQPDCTGCTSSSPYSTLDTSACYATLADCEAAEGSGCQLCD